MDFLHNFISNPFLTVSDANVLPQISFSKCLFVFLQFSAGANHRPVFFDGAKIQINILIEINYFA